MCAKKLFLRSVPNLKKKVSRRIIIKKRDNCNNDIDHFKRDTNSDVILYFYFNTNTTTE